MKKAGIKDYEKFAKDILSHIKDKPISLEVFSDDFKEMERQANEIASWGENVYVKIPVTNTKGESSGILIEELSKNGVRVNVTAIMTYEQVETVFEALEKSKGAYISVFAGRIADAGVDPLPIMVKCVELLKEQDKIELIWASPREIFNIIQADNIGCHIITVTNDLLKKLGNIGKDLTVYSLDTVKMFYDDAVSSNFKL
jgi:transaldolase